MNKTNLEWTSYDYITAPMLHAFVCHPPLPGWAPAKLQGVICFNCRRKIAAVFFIGEKLPCPVIGLSWRHSFLFYDTYAQSGETWWFFLRGLSRKMHLFSLKKSSRRHHPNKKPAGLRWPCWFLLVFIDRSIIDRFYCFFQSGIKFFICLAGFEFPG